MQRWPPYYNKEMETIEEERLRSIQEEKLRNQLDYVCKRSPFYGRKFREIGFSPGDFRSLEDLKELPFTTKDELRVSQSAHPPLGDHSRLHG